VRGGEAGQLGDQLAVPPERQVGLDTVLGGGQPQLLQGGSGGRGVRAVGERGAPPQLQTFAQQRRGASGVTIGQRHRLAVGPPRGGGTEDLEAHTPDSQRNIAAIS